MSEWREYTGSPEQIAEIAASKSTVLMRYSTGREVKWSNSIFRRDLAMLGFADVTHYLLCKPHPLADMICQQARTGQPVWIKREEHWGYVYECTDTPDWNIPNAEYSFTPFEELNK